MGGKMHNDVACVAGSALTPRRARVLEVCTSRYSCMCYGCKAKSPRRRCKTLQLCARIEACKRSSKTHNFPNKACCSESRHMRQLCSITHPAG